ncbi:P4H6, partial [Symbiodinium pilosum]
MPQPEDMHSCEHGLKVQPEIGSVLLWYSLRPNGNSDPNSLHASCPVQDGLKWSANYWVWNKPRDFGIDLPDADYDDEYSGESSEATEGDPVPRNNVNATFENRHTEESLFLFWKPPDRQQEAFMGEIRPQESLKMFTYPGHLWHFRSGVDQSSTLLYVQ